LFRKPSSNIASTLRISFTIYSLASTVCHCKTTANTKQQPTKTYAAAAKKKQRKANKTPRNSQHQTANSSQQHHHTANNTNHIQQGKKKKKKKNQNQPGTLRGETSEEDEVVEEDEVTVLSLAGDGVTESGGASAHEATSGLNQFEGEIGHRALDLHDLVLSFCQALALVHVLHHLVRLLFRLLNALVVCVRLRCVLQ
jgi:histone deacetylase complex regulatory component SIN3